MKYRMAGYIHLDPYDIFNIEKTLSLNPLELINKGIIGITVIDGVITLYLTKDEKYNRCVFLNKDDRCRIHSFRPGFCRLFPLGRIYDEDDSFDYFVQVHECPKAGKTNVQIKEWLGIEEIDKYETFISQWHKTIKRISEYVISTNDEKSVNDINMKMLNHFFLFSYDTTKDFFEQINNRFEEWS